VGSSLVTGIGVRYLGRGGLVERDEQGSETGEYSFSTGVASAAVSSGIGGGWSVGLALGLGWEDVGDQGATGFTASAGVAGMVSGQLEVGAVIRGIGLAPSWNGIHKDMPTEVSAGARYSFGDMIAVFGGGRYGFDTIDSFCAGAEFETSGFSVSAGYELSPDADECTGLFGGIGYTYEAGEVYSIELGFSQRDALDWPVLAGLSVLF
jgi:hypothetical protein